MSRREFKDRYKAQIHEIAGGEPDSIATFLARFSEKRGRRIEAVAVNGVDGFGCGYGFWTREADFITVAGGSSPTYSDHVKAHEGGHYVLGHVGEHSCNRNDSKSLTAWLESLFPHMHRDVIEQFVAQMPPELRSGEVKGVYQRTVFSEPEEWEAETFAYVLNNMVNGPNRTVFGGEAAKDPLQRLFGPATRK